ncbi:MAG: ATP-dependent DNA ligase, partial [archaeon]
MKFIELARTFDALEKTAKRLEMTSILAELFRKARAEDIEKTVYLLQGRVRPAFEGIEIGVGEKFAEQAIAKATGYSLKDVAQLYQKTGDLGLVAEELVKDKKQRSFSSNELTISHVYEIYLKMSKASGSGSQDLKIKLLTELLNNASPLEARYIVRIPLGRLGLGVGDSTILDALSFKEKGDKSLRERLERAFNVTSDIGLVAKTFYEKGIEGIDHVQMAVNHPLLPALCERLPSAEEIIKKLGKCAVEHKYDGMRVQIHKRGGNVRIYSRRQEELTHMFPDIARAVKEHVKADEAILDGEALSYNELTGEYLPFQQTIQRKRKYDIEKMQKEFPLHVFLFDVMF